ncbi:MAG: type III pantothenate kinase [Candidatus Margulisiibacteriota bacterium]|jgi:type III pantothenate kinase
MNLKTSKNELLLLIDIGNSYTAFAELDLAQGFNKVDLAHLPIKKIAEKRTTLFIDTFQESDFLKYKKIIIASVVTQANQLFKNLPQAIFVNHLNTPLKNNLEKPEQIGADRLINALAGFSLTNTSTLIIDSGTATTFCYVDAFGVYQGGVILPGLEISSKALHDYTSKVPLIWVKEKNVIFGKSTKEAVEVGLFYSFIYTINSFIDSYRKFDPKIKVVGTGTAIKEFKNYFTLDFFEANLIFLGLSIFALSLKL